MSTRHLDAIAARRRAAALRVDELDRELIELRAMRERQHDDDEHDPDGVSLSSEWSRIEGLREAAAASLAAVDTAAERAASGRGGICERCGDPIPAARLEVRPDATICVACGTAR